MFDYDYGMVRIRQPNCFSFPFYDVSINFILQYSGCTGSLYIALQTLVLLLQFNYVLQTANSFSELLEPYHSTIMKSYFPGGTNYMLLLSSTWGRRIHEIKQLVSGLQLILVWLARLSQTCAGGVHVREEAVYHT